MRRPLTRILLVATLAMAAFAAWTWLRPYEWKADPGARFHIQVVHVAKDHSYAWVNVFLEHNGGEPHELEKPITLTNAAGQTFEPAETTLKSRNGQGTSEIQLRFWMQASELDQPLTLHLNEGTLSVKSTTGPPDLGTDGRHTFSSNRW